MRHLFVDGMGMRLLGQRDKPRGPRQGESFRRSTRFAGVETAKILSIKADPLGITHVRFSLKIASPMTVNEETRTLSLESFRRLYPGVAD
jgi:hypothetical protein